MTIIGDFSKQHHEKASIAWRNLRVEVNELRGWKLQKKSILSGLTGSFNFGTLAGLLGTSGAGKTSLLNCLSGTACSGLAANSEIYLGGQRAQSTVSYYIRQHVQESIVGELTVGQILRYAFAFKNGRRGGEEAARHLEATMAALMLPAELESRPFGKCSGGEQKRVAIAQELMSLTAPSFLFVDEPTTGLDSSSAYQVMYCLQQLAKTSHMTIIASIHSPNDETLQLFDKLYVLARGGVCIYSGPPAEIKFHLQQTINFITPDHQPPIETLIKFACNGINDSNVIRLANQVITSENAALTSQIPHLTLYPAGIPTPRKRFTISNLLTSLMRQFRITFLAQMQTFLFLPIVFFCYFASLSTIFVSEMATATGCYSLDNATNVTCSIEDPREYIDLVRENDNYLAFVLLMVGFLTTILSVVVYGSHVKVFQSEHRNHWYSVSVFYLSTGVASFLELSLNALLASLLSYFLSGQHAADGYSLNATRFGLYLLFLWLLCLYNQAIGQLIGIILVDHPTMALLLCELVYTIFSMFNGLFVKLHRMENAMLEAVSDLIAMNFITKGVYYAIYGVDRCDLETEYSRMLLDHQIDAEKIGEYVGRVLLNVAIIKVATFAIMYCKFTDWRRWNRRQSQKKLEQIKDEQVCVKFDLKSNGVALEEIKQKVDFTKDDDGLTQAERQHFTGKIAIAWRNLSLHEGTALFEKSASNEGRHLILRQLGGQVQFGTLIGLMGTSGSGKTSLLRVLNGQCKGRLGGETEIYLSKLRKVSTCFITQDVSGHLLPGLTAKQSVLYASKLKNPQRNVDHESIAVKWLAELALLNTTNTKVENCSGGERKRLAVALELTSLEMPNLICIDEPTSGLDSHSAEIVVASLRQLTLAHPLAIVTSIHQPSTEVLHLFDQLYVLARGGVCIYSGPPTQIQARLDRALDKPQSGVHFPIETLIKQSCFDQRNTTTRNLAQLQLEQFTHHDPTLLEQTTLTPDGVLPNRTRFSLHSVLSLSQRLLLYICGYLWKEWLLYFIVSIGFILNLRTTFPSSIIYANGCISLEDDLRSCHKSAQQIADEFRFTDNTRYNYFATNIYLMLVVVCSAVNFFQELPYFANEHRNGWYSTGAYYLVKSSFEVIPLVATNFLFVYFYDVFDAVVPSGMYWPFFYLLSLSQIAVLGMAHCFALLGRGHLSQIMIIGCATYFLLLMIGNAFIPFTKMSYFWQCISNFSVPRFLYESINLVQYGFGRCRPKEVQVILYSMSVEDADYWPNVAMLLFNLILFRVIALYMLVKKVNPVVNRQKQISKARQHFNESLRKSTESQNGYTNGFISS